MELLAAPARRERRLRVPPPHPRPEPTGERRADVQGLRAVAVALVVAYHAGLPVPGGFAGVDVFFAISGFVITGSLIRELRHGRLDLPAFYARRARRLLPALAVLLVVTAALSVLAAPLAAQATGARTGIAASLFAANVYLAQLPTGYFDPAAALDPLLHTWTLAVEEQFYLVFPIVLLAGWRARRRLGSMSLVAALSVASLVLALVAAGSAFGFYGSPTRAWEFGAGALVALAAPWAVRLPASASALLGLVGLAALGTTGFLLRATAGDPRDLVPAVAGTCALLLAGTGPAARLLAARPAVALGNLSYSVYLWHWPLIVFALALWPRTPGIAALAAAASLAPAWASYRWVEEPIRRNRGLTGRRLVALTAVCVVIPVGAAAALLAAQGAIGRSDAVRTWAAASAKHADELRGCNSLLPLDERRPGTCMWARPGAQGLVALVGDSQAGQLTEPVVLAARRRGLDTLVATANACPFAEVAVEGSTVDGAACRRFVHGTLAALERLRPKLIMIASRSDDYVNSPRIAFAGTTDPVAKAAAWERGTASVLRRLERTGARIVLVHPIPKLGEEPRGCAALTVLLHRCTGEVGRIVSEAERRPAVAAETAALAGSARTRALGFDDLLCDREHCRGSRGRTWTYRDIDHLSVAGALLLSGRIERVLEEEQSALFRERAARAGTE